MKRSDIKKMLIGKPFMGIAPILIGQDGSFVTPIKELNEIKKLSNGMFNFSKGLASEIKKLNKTFITNDESTTLGDSGLRLMTNCCSVTNAKTNTQLVVSVMIKDGYISGEVVVIPIHEDGTRIEKHDVVFDTPLFDKNGSYHIDQDSYKIIKDFYPKTLEILKGLSKSIREANKQYETKRKENSEYSSDIKEITNSFLVSKDLHYNEMLINVLINSILENYDYTLNYDRRSSSIEMEIVKIDHNNSQQSHENRAYSDEELKSCVCDDEDEVCGDECDDNCPKITDKESPDCKIKRMRSDDPCIVKVMDPFGISPKAIKRLKRLIVGIVKDFNGIIDKTCLLEMVRDIVFENLSYYTLTDNNLFMSAYPKFSVEKAKRKVCLDCRAVSRTVVQELCEESLFEWRNLIVTAKGYDRIIKFCSEMMCMQFAHKMGSKIDVGIRRFPKNWSKDRLERLMH